MRKKTSAFKVTGSAALFLQLRGAHGTEGGIAGPTMTQFSQAPCRDGLYVPVVLFLLFGW